jgi:iron-sulfur cluster repair protein YtfE (RIC family)
MSETRILSRPPMDLLKTEHQHILVLLDEYEGLSSTDITTKARLFDEIGRELTLHARIEETLFYPLIQELTKRNGQNMVKRALLEHHGIQSLLAELSTMSPENQRFDQRMQDLRESLERHLHLEERLMFPAARSLSLKALDEVAREMHVLREELEREPR